jgi:PAS domain S-box-containing protein
LRVAIITDDADLGSTLAAEVEDEGHDAALDVTRAELLLVDAYARDYMTRARAAVADNPGLDLVAMIRPTQLTRLPEDISDFMVLPLAPGELGARLRLWALRRGERGVTRDALLAHAVDAAADVVEVADPRAVLQYVNPAFTHKLGYGADEVIGKTPAEVMRSSMHPKEYFQELDRTLRAGLVWKGLLISKAKDGRLVHFDATVSPVFDAERRCTHHVAVKRDITERLAAEAQLRSANHELEQARDAALEANRVKSQFLANMSHELRTPLNAIIGYSEMMIEEARDIEEPDLEEDAKKIQVAGRHLLGLINDILDLSKVEAGRVELFLEDVELRGLLEEVVDTVRPLAVERGNTISLAFHLPVEVVTADVTRLKQVLFNLVSNANKFTENGSVVIEARPHPTDEGFYRVAVRDTGIGMTSEQLQRLFRPFVQADPSTTRRYGGTGLGLTISQHFCEMMGGAITVDTKVGDGSTFTVSLPLVSAKRTLRAPSSDGRSGGRVLVVDDDPAIHDLLRRTLEPAGFEVELATNGEAGLAQARERPPDAIILDVVMPGLDGWWVLTELKRDKLTRDIPVVMLTFLESRSTGLALGATDYLVKPVEPSRVVQVIRRHLGAIVATVLVVEDDAPTRDIMRRVLTGAGHVVREATNGLEALATLEHERPDLILLDLMMPELDGLGFLDRMRQREELRDLPVVVVTAKTLTADERSRLEGTTKEIVQKGDLSPQELMNTVLRHVTSLLVPQRR